MSRSNRTTTAGLSVHALRPASIVCLAVALTIGCGPEQIRVYRVPKEQHADADIHNHSQAHNHDQDEPQTAAPVLRWKTPGGWQEQPATQFRVGSFKVAAADGKQADISIIPLPNRAGSELDNVNRWRGQVGLAPVSAEELAKLAQPVALAGQTNALYDLGGADSRILAAMQPREGTTWFFKMTGDTALVAAQKPVFIEFLKTLEFAAVVPTPASVEPTPAPVQQTWNAPADWKPAAPGQFLVAKFLINTGDGQGSVNISSAIGDGGGLSANVNRWRQQLGLGQLSADDLAAATKPLQTAAGQGTLIEMAGSTSALVAVIVPRGGQSWFFKLMGPPGLVTAQKEAFLKFVQEAKP